ncbi:MAG TPA: hypothetical protein VFA33_08685 [Bryobacteraceae bacterium]|nr:hypothetical protein [Bryobacteraceae bacterium]
MVDTWLERSTTAPKIADLIALAGEVMPNQSFPPGCDVCHGEYWIVTDRGAKRCQCARGQALRGRDIANAVGAAR